MKPTCFPVVFCLFDALLAAGHKIPFNAALAKLDK
jgi:hypothetical protein